MTARSRRESYHHGNLREALVEAALRMIAERGLGGLSVAELARAAGVSPAAPYRHFRDRDSVLAEVARRGFEALEAAMQAALGWGRGADPVAALEACAQAHLAYAAAHRPEYAAMFDGDFPVSSHPELSRARDAAFAVLRAASGAACARSTAAQAPPALMVALHVWALTHGIATLYLGRGGAGQLPMRPAELLEAGLIVYLQSLGLEAGAPRV